MLTSYQASLESEAGHRQSSSESDADDGAIEVSDAEAYSGDEDGWSDEDGVGDGGESGKDDERPRKRRSCKEETSRSSLLHSRDVANFMKLSQALRLLLSGRLTDAKVDEATQLLSEYGSELLEVRQYFYQSMRLSHGYMRSSMDLQSLNPTITTQSIRHHSFVTLGHCTASGRFFLKG